MTSKLLEPKPRDQYLHFRATREEREFMEKVREYYGASFSDVLRIGIYYFSPDRAIAISKGKRELPKVGE
jgi:hypothetical protein